MLTTPISPKSPLNEHLRLHGDGVKDVAFWVTDANKARENTTQNSAKSMPEPETFEDENGKVTLASIQTYGDTIHTFVERNSYKGIFILLYIHHKIP